MNRELDDIDAFLKAVAQRLKMGARLVAMTFHSLEDRIVKHTLRALAPREGGPLRILTKKPITPRPDELERNPRARSAKLRAAECVGVTSDQRPSRELKLRVYGHIDRSI